MSDLQFAVDAAGAASYYARQADKRLSAIEGALILVLREQGWSLRALRVQFPHLSRDEIRELAGRVKP